MLDIDKKSEFIAVAVFVPEKNFKIEMLTFRSKSGALKKEALECSQETQLKTVSRDFVKEAGFEVNVCPSVRDRLKSPRASCFHFSLSRQTGAVLCCCFM